MFNFKFDWDYRLELGIEELDLQHQQLFKIGRQIEQLLLKRCLGTTDEYLLKILYELRNYVTYHFYHEENFMNHINFPDKEAHQQKHEELKNYVNQINYTALCQDPNAELPQIKEYLVSWIFQHLIQEDRKISEFVAEHHSIL